MDVKFSCFGGIQDERVSMFLENLPSPVAHMKLDFSSSSWRGQFNFENFCKRMKQMCPHLHTLILHHAVFSINLSSVINLCSKYLPNLKVLILPMSVFGNNCKEEKFGGISKIEILDISRCMQIGRFTLSSEVPCLKKLNLSGIVATDNWEFFCDDNVSFLHQLEYLNLGLTYIISADFRILQNHAVNLTELFLCYVSLNDDDFKFNKPVFPLLKTICIINSRFVTCEGIVSLVMSCQSLVDVYVDMKLAESYANHPFVILNVLKLGIVKGIIYCNHHKELEYMLQ